jgi:catalase
VANSYQGPAAAPDLFGPDPSWLVAADHIVRSAYTLDREDNDFGQANAMVNIAMDEPAWDRLVSNIVGHAKQGVEEPVLSRLIEYWCNVDRTIGVRVAWGLGEDRAA